MLENGQSYAGDLLVGADGIWSKVAFYTLYGKVFPPLSDFFLKKIYNAISLPFRYILLLTYNKRICMKTWSDQVSTISGP